MLTAAVIVLTAIAAVLTYERTPLPKQTVHLAVLPLETDGKNKSLADSLLNEAVARLGQVKSSGGLVIVRPNTVSQKKTETPDKASKQLKATHVLTGSLQWKNGRALLQTVLSDATSLAVRQWRAEFEPNEVQYIPLALAGVVTGALHLPPINSETALKPAAIADFSKGVTLARREDRLDAALPLLERAVAASRFATRRMLA
jgi:TolB-like protein